MPCTELMTPATSQSNEPCAAVGSSVESPNGFDTVDSDRDPHFSLLGSGHLVGSNDRVLYNDSLRSEERRLRTYREYGWQPFSAWPSDHRVTPEKLAEAGLYYTGNRDMVRCAFCHGGLSQWQPSDDPKEEHERLFPHCSFRGSTTAGNVPLPRPSRFQQTAFECCADPRHPEFRDVRNRLHTFAHLSPSTKQGLPPVLKLAEAGFYLTDPTSESVTCFWCDGHLRQWSPNEDPWMEHARWFPRCQFVLSMKGRDYVESVRVYFSGSAPPVGEPFSGSESASMEDPGHDIAPGEERLSGQQQQDLLHVSPSMEALAAFDVLATYGVTREQVRSIAIEQQRRQRNFLEPLSASELQQTLRMPLLSQSATAESQTSTTAVTESGNVLSQASDPDASGLMEVEQPPAESSSRASSAGAEDVLTCRICHSAERQRAFLPCGHFAACVACATSARVCPICSSIIRGTYQVFLP